MIAHLRRRHRVMTGVLAVAAPLVFVAALLTRPPLPSDATLAARAARPGQDAVLLEQYVVRVDRQPVEIALYGRPAGAPPQIVIERGAPHTPVPPDVLVYWQAAEPTQRPDADAQLLGPWSPARRNVFALPRGASQGSIVFYSLAHDAVIGSQWPVVTTP